MYRLTLETLLGITLQNDHLQIAPCIPKHWQSYKIHYRYRDTVYHITINTNQEKSADLPRVILDDVVVQTSQVNQVNTSCTIPLTDDRQEHNVLVDL
jgi:cellobiose phosphorylase